MRGGGGIEQPFPLSKFLHLLRGGGGRGEEVFALHVKNKSILIRGLDPVLTLRLDPVIKIWIRYSKYGGIRFSKLNQIRIRSEQQGLKSI